MATLEKIRKRSALLFTIIIVALLAFILGDFLTSGRTFFSDPTTLAKVDGHKININEFSSRVEQIRAQQQDRGNSNIDIAIIQRQVLDQMIFEALMNEEIDRLGITVTDAELTAAMTGADALPMVVNQVQQLGAENPEQFYDMAFNPTKYGIAPDQAQQLQAAWLEMEKNLSESLRQQKFGQLFMGTLTANKLDAKAIYDDNAKQVSIILAKQDLSTLNDDEFPVSEADIKAQYDKQKNMFRLDEPTRSIDYIVVDVTPSDADRAAASQEIEEAVTALTAQPGTEGVNGNVNFGVVRHTSPKSRIANSAIKSALDTMAVGGVKIASMVGEKYTIVKLLNVSEEIDSINFDFAAVEGDIAVRDSVLSELNSGAKASALAEAGKLAGSQDSIWASLLDPNLAQLKDMLLSAPTGRYISLDTVAGQQAYRLVRINNRKAPVRAYDYAEITYTVEPSTQTLHTLEGELSRFVNGNNTAEKLAENAPANNYGVFPAEVTASTLSLNNIPDTREAVNWAMEAKKGEVSPIFKDEQNTRMVVVALKDIWNDGFRPVSDPALNKYLTDEARKDKKAAKLIADYSGKGKTVYDYASLMKSSVDSLNVTFAQPMIPGFYTRESALLGRAAAAQPGQLNGPFEGGNSVMVFEVINIGQQGLPFDEASAASMFNRQQGIEPLSRNFQGILRKNAKVTNRIQQFYRK